ncbi:MAG: M48 family metallopeptidase [Burkholderiales bacterium]|jgi:predicted metal-dependent hydrolase|nr:M48 family metallopeptidase [Burkholderiales bacterium]
MRAEHPPAEQAIELAGCRIPYRLRRSPRRRTIALLIDDRGLQVAAPLRAPQDAIDALLREHARWVIRKFGDWQRKRPLPRSWIAGEQVMLRGNALTLELRAGVPRARQDGDRLLVGAAPDAAAIEASVHRWIKDEAIRHFTDRCRDYSTQLGLPEPAVRLSNARTRWGSCHASGRIRMNWRLIQLPEAWIDYVAAHEVAHLRQMNHSPAFWQTVATLVPDHRELRAALRREAHRYLLP